MSVSVCVCICELMVHQRSTDQWPPLAREGLLPASCQIDFYLGHSVLQRRRTLLLSHPVSLPVLLLPPSTPPSVCLSPWPGIHPPSSCTQTPTSWLNCEPHPTSCQRTVSFRISVLKVILLRMWMLSVHLQCKGLFYWFPDTVVSQSGEEGEVAKDGEGRQGCYV